MENKRKKVYIVIFVITTIIAACIAVYFGMSYKNLEEKYAEENRLLNEKINELNSKIEELNSDKNTNIDNNINNNVNDSSENDKIQNLIMNDSDKIEYNKLLSSNAIIMSAIRDSKNSINGTWNGGSFNSKEKLFITTIVGIQNYKQEYQQNKRDKDIGLSYVKKDFINNISNKIFKENINFNDTGAELNNDEVLVNVPTGWGISLYKSKSLEFNPKTNEYSFTFDSLDCSNDISNIQDFDYTNYPQSKVEATYLLKYKVIDGNNVLLSLDRIYVK